MSHPHRRRAPALWRAALGALGLSLVLGTLAASPVAANGELDWADQFSSTQGGEADGVATTDEAAYVVGRTDHPFLRKYLHNGDMEWERTLGPETSIAAVAADSSDVYIAGVTNQALPGQPAPHGYEWYVARYSPAGSLAWARQFSLPTTGGGPQAFLSLKVSSAGVFVAGAGSTRAFVRLYDKDGNSIWTRYVADSLESLSVDPAGPALITEDPGRTSATVSRFDNGGTARPTWSVPAQYHDAAPAPDGGLYITSITFEAHSGLRHGFLRRYDTGGHLIWTRSRSGEDFSWGGVAQFGDRVYVEWATAGSDSIVDRWEAVSGASGVHIWSHEFALEPDSNVITQQLAVGPQGGYIVGLVGGALAGHDDPITGKADAFVMKFGIDEVPPSILESGFALPPYVQLVCCDFTMLGQWKLSDDISGVDRVELQESSDGTTWNDVPLSEPRASSALIDVKPNESHRFRLRATDRSGNTGAWAMSKLFETDLLQEDGGGTSYDADWKPATLAGANGGSVMTTSTAGATAKVAFSGNAIGLVTAQGPHRGKVAVYLDGTKITTLDLYAPSASTDVLVYAHGTSSPGTHLLKLVAKGTQGRSRIDIDAYEVLSTSP